jgi:yeast amino acid transporter
MDPKLTGDAPYVQEIKSSDGEHSPEERHSITGDVFVHDHGADTELRRILSTRHLTMIALGSSIGMGLWLGSGTSLIRGGPAALFLGYMSELPNRISTTRLLIRTVFLVS